MEIVIGNEPAASRIDTAGLPVLVTKAFDGLTLLTQDGERLQICMRDSGFEVTYSGNDGEGSGFSAGLIRFVSGNVTRTI